MREENGPTDSSAEFIQSKRRPAGGYETSGVERAISQVVIEVAVQLVGPAHDRKTADRRAGRTELRRHLRRDQTKFPDRINRWRGLIEVAVTRARRQTVHQILDHEIGETVNFHLITGRCILRAVQADSPLNAWRQ